MVPSLTELLSDGRGKTNKSAEVVGDGSAVLYPISSLLIST